MPFLLLRPPPTSLAEFEKPMRRHGFPAGYGLSFVFWHELCEEHGSDVPLRFLRRLQSEEGRDTKAAVAALEEITGEKDIWMRLKQADVDRAIEVIKAVQASSEEN